LKKGKKGSRKDHQKRKNPYLTLSPTSLQGKASPTEEGRKKQNNLIGEKADRPCRGKTEEKVLGFLLERAGRNELVR